MKFDYATLSKVGGRWRNEDSFRVGEDQERNRWFGLVCDGMGGHAMGQVAGETVSDAIVAYWTGHVDEPDSKDKVEKACRKASVALEERAYSMGHVEMGTTLVMASIEVDTVTIAHVGDSRCYLQRPGDGLLYLTKDHIRSDFGWEVLDRCFFSYRPEVSLLDVIQFKVKAGDRILLCSDGLYKSMAPDILLTSMMDEKPVADILDVYDSLCERRGDDNYTAVLLRIF